MVVYYNEIRMRSRNNNLLLENIVMVYNMLSNVTKSAVIFVNCQWCAAETCTFQFDFIKIIYNFTHCTKHRRMGEVLIV